METLKKEEFISTEQTYESKNNTEEVMNDLKKDLNDIESHKKVDWLEIIEPNLKKLIKTMVNIKTLDCELNLSLSPYTQVVIKLKGKDICKEGKENNLYNLFAIAKQVTALNEFYNEQRNNVINKVTKKTFDKLEEVIDCHPNHSTWKRTKSGKAYEIPSNEWNDLNIKNSKYCEKCSALKHIYEMVEKKEGFSEKIQKKYSFFPRSVWCKCDVKDFSQRERVVYFKKGDAEYKS